MSTIEQNTNPNAVQDVIAEQQGERRRREAIINELESLFHNIDRCILLMRVYPTGHPLIDSLVEQTHGRFLDFIHRQGYLFMYLEATELKTEDGDVFFSNEISEQEHFIWYTPAADGIVSVQMQPEMTAGEFMRFVQVINRASMGRAPVDDDTVTLLWEEDLQGIDVHAIEGFVDVKDMDLFGEYQPKEVKKFVYDAAFEPVGEAKQKLQTLFESDGAKMTTFGSLHEQVKPITDRAHSLPPEMVADAFRVDMTWVDHLAEEWDAGEDLEYRLIEALLSILRTVPDSEHGANAADTIHNIAVQLLDAENYDAVATVLKLLQKRLDGVKVGERNPRDELLEFLTDPMRVEALLFQAQKYVGKRKQLIELLSLLDHNNIQTFVLNTLADEKKEVTSLPTLIDIVLAVTNANNQRFLIAQEFTSKDAYLQRMLMGLRGRTLGELNIGPRLFVKALEHKQALIRKSALEAAEDAWYTPKVIEDYIKPLMSDEHEQVRQLAFEVMRKQAPEEFKAQIGAIVEAGDFLNRPPVEMRYMMRLYLDVFPERRGHLHPLVDVTGWFDEQKRKTAVAAAMLILSIGGDEEGTALIVKRSKAFTTHPALKSEYQGLLERFTKSVVVDEVHQAEEA